MRYMLMIYTAPGTWEGMSEEERNSTMGEYYDYTDSLENAGILRAACTAGERRHRDHRPRPRRRAADHATARSRRPGRCSAGTT